MVAPARRATAESIVRRPPGAGNRRYNRAIRDRPQRPTPLAIDGTAPRAGGALDRRRFLAVLSATGVGGAAFAEALWAEAAATGGITADALASAEAVAGLALTDAERALMLDGLDELREDYRTLRGVPLANGTPPAFRFDPIAAAGGDPVGLPGGEGEPARVGLAANQESEAHRHPASGGDLPALTAVEELAFAPVAVLARYVAERRVTALELTRMYLGRLRRYDPRLQCVVNLTEERALAQAAEADREIAAGRYRGPLHGIPWGAKDLVAVAGYPTTWGATPFREQRIEEDATVVRRLDAAGAILVAKLSAGALAWGDVWFGGTTRNPWNLEEGSSGSSAGSAAATAAGLVGFSLGTETYGSIVSPSYRCGATGLRPTFGRVSRNGVMALSWTLDKVGPICRSAEDCGLVLAAIAGADGRDPTAVDRPFDPQEGEGAEPGVLRVGYVPELFTEELPEDAPERAREQRQLDLAVLDDLRRLGIRLQPIALPARPVAPLALILTAEAAAAFDELSRSGQDDLLVRQEENAWPNVFRQGQLIPAVDYIRAQRVRTLLAEDMAALFAGGLDAYVTPAYGGSNLLLTNLTGHPMVALPNGFRGEGTPGSITMTGALFGEAKLLALADLYQRATGFHSRRPRLDSGGG